MLPKPSFPSVGCLLLLLLAGCGGAGRRAMTGTVTLDGTPVDGGSISFLAGEDGPRSGGRIEDGRYAIARERGPVPGKYRVEIRWPKKTGKQIPFDDPPKKIDETKEVIPAKYNTQSTLEVEVLPGSTSFDFDLKSK